MNVFPRAPGPPNHLDVVLPDVETLRLRAYNVFYAMPVQVPCCLFDSIIIIRNPEKDGTLESRAKHLTHGWKDGKPIIDVEKCRWLPETVSNRAAAGVF